MNTTPPLPALINLLESLRENRAALANLRRGLGQPRSIAPEMHRYIVPLLPDGAGRWREQTHYLIAALYAIHPQNANEGNLGHHFGRAAALAGESGAESVERRFVALLNAHPDDLAFHLRQAISFLKSKDEIAVNWRQLFYDVLAWNHDERRIDVQRQWANGYWRRSSAPVAAPEATTST